MRPERSGAGIAAALAVVVALAAPAGAHGPSTPESYHWVHAPPGVDSAGAPGSVDTVYDPELFVAGIATAWTADEQAVVELTAADRSAPSPVAIGITPLDPAALDRAPSGEHFNGNAYRIEVDAEGWEPATSVRLQTPYPPSGLWSHGADGWDPMPSDILPTGEVVAAIPNGERELVLAAGWAPPSHRWYQRLAHAPALVAGACLAAGVGGWTVGRRRHRSIARDR